jgi:hypothetical protein
MRKKRKKVPLDPFVQKLMTKRQIKKYQKYGILPAWVIRSDKQLASMDLGKVRNPDRSRNPIEKLWDNVALPHKGGVKPMKT